MVNLHAPCYTAWLSMTDEQRAPWAAYFSAVNHTPVLAVSDLRRQAQKEAQARLEARWKMVRYPHCEHCDGQGFYEFTGNNPNRHAAIECLECDGLGYTEVPFADWLDTVADDDPDFIAYQENY